MAVTRVTGFEPTEADLPYELLVLLENSADELSGWQNQQAAHNFVPADYVLVFEAMLWVRRNLLRGPGKCLLEWGSGFGIATLIGRMLGWEASGIEIHADLIESARLHAKEFDLPAAFYQGNLFDVEEDPGLPKRFRIENQDLVYVYPWPDQELKIFDLFNRFAAPGAYLLAYYGVEDIQLFERTL